MIKCHKPDQLFGKAIIFTDLHLGKKNNDRQHNIDCCDFIRWAITEGKNWNADTVMCLGDWTDTRRTLHVSTMNYSLYCMELLANSFSNFFLITGNHDTFYKDKREINSVEFGRNIKNCTIIKEIMTEGNVTLVPWLVGDEWKQIPDIKTKYMFGHFELPHFLMNAMVEMPDLGTINRDHFRYQDYVFSGHFHKRQIKKNKHNTNVAYIGNAFPHNFADAWDEERGLMFLEWGKEPFFKSWPDQPTYRNMKLSQLLSEPKKVIKDRASLKCVVDVELAYEEASFIKETFMAHFGLRDLILVPKTQDDDQANDVALENEFQSIDQIVLEGLKAVESSSVDPNLLMEIYRNL